MPVNKTWNKGVDDTGATLSLRSIMLNFIGSSAGSGGPEARWTLEYPIPPGQSLRDLPAGALDDLDRALAMGVHLLRRGRFMPSQDPLTYLFVKREFQGNLFQIPLH